MEHTKKSARFVLNWILLLSTLTFISSCNSSGGSGGAGVADTNQTGEQNLSDTGNTTVTEGHYIDQIQSIAANSSCASYSWSGRGKAPLGYIKGMALTYARSFCRLKMTEAAPTDLAILFSTPAGNAATDALAVYAANFTNLSMNITTAGVEPLNSLYTLGVGLGMRESSGKYCEGRDLSASNTSASTAEAGMFQTSYDSMNASAELSKLYNEYRTDTSKCFLDVFKAGVSCSSNNTIAGTGPGADYQAFNKSCPAFAAEYAMIMLRVRRNHYGPINRKEAEVTPACNQMIKSVQDFIENDLNACDEIM